MPGPLPDPKRKRRNAPTIPTTELPTSGLAAIGATPPAPPAHLGKAAREWWQWAWDTPQAVGWGVGGGQEAIISRRASLEDDLAALAEVEALDLLDVLEDGEVVRRFKDVIRRLAALTGGRLAVTREMREIDDRLGLTPRGLAALRWTIVADPVADEDNGQNEEGTKRQSERRLRVAAG